MALIVSFNRELSRTRFRRPQCSPNRSHRGSIFPKAGRTAFRRAGVTDVSSHNLRKTFATRLLSRGAAITVVQHLLGHASVKTTEKAYAAFVKNERFNVCNPGRLHPSLGPGIPNPPVDLPVTPHEHRHRIPAHLKVVAHPVLGGLHHEYGVLAKAA